MAADCFSTTGAANGSLHERSVAVPGSSVRQFLQGLCSRGISFNDESLNCLSQADDATQINVLLRLQEFLRNPSALLVHLLDKERTVTAAKAEFDSANAVTLAKSSPIVSAVRPEEMGHRPESLPQRTEHELGSQAFWQQARSQACSREQSYAQVPVSNDQSGLPPSQYLMGQRELDAFRCSRIASQCLHGADEPQQVEYALSLCSSDLAYLTVCRVRNVESFPWKLPAGWYALHVEERALTDQFRSKVVSAGISIPANLPTSCIAAVVKLGLSKPAADFDNGSWATGQWCQAIEDVVMLQRCVPVLTEELRRLWVLPEQLRSQVLASIPVHLQKVAAKVSRSDLLAVSTPSRSQRSKRPRRSSLLHASFPQEAPVHVDRLQRLYPHSRDHACYLDDKLHKYCVLGKQYDLSVSGWWKMFFEDFDPKQMSKRIVQRHLDTLGFRCCLRSGELPESVLLSSIYNLAQHVRVLQRRGDDEFLDILRAATLAAQDDYAGRGAAFPFATERILELGRNFLMNSKKPDGPSCYYLMLLYTCECSPVVRAAQIAQTWELHGSLESLKGTYLHKKIELFINAMARPMERDGSSFVAVENLLMEEPPADEYSAEAVMKHIAWSTDPELWNHPLAQRFFEKEVCEESLEFSKFKSWLATKRRWTPVRLEWSLYNEDLNVAGQIDSLWLDLDTEGSFVMVDWKRARELLTDDVEVLERQSFGKKGTGPCAHLCDTAWSHYFVQQTLYAYLLSLKYGIVVRRLMLAQCHPDVGGANFNEAPLTADFKLAEALARFLVYSRGASS